MHYHYTTVDLIKLKIWGLFHRTECRRIEEDARIEHEFFKQFGFLLFKKSTRSVQQQVVAQFLNLRARAYLSACDKQTSLLNTELGPYTENALRKHDKELYDATQQVTKTKAEFWGPHDAAKKAGFTVKLNAADYLV